ncbi:glycoside hydrolase family 92 protein [Puniceicoccales bacterium CK1056]|uniref:Glycoside hydrolase family 92 protein n=1 Tax=Oceanipulchritudo coccoides TaxID=2706888 RepID=A0A6B2LY70_9BACT|nr:GH92 family glycosyl hydrolase [Oceanipulchritudo coccoides]NDV61571.1 glycoside hydrolase family 92 protein [Oceanipulchritudo coccoides]
MKKNSLTIGWNLAALLLTFTSQAFAASYTSMVMPLMGTDSSREFSAGNVYPAISRPWGMNTWTPQTGEMGSGWIYTYDEMKIVGIKQTHQPSPWLRDYGQFSVMPVTGQKTFHEKERSSYFSHKAETALPHYYRVFLADHNTTVEMTPTDRAAFFRVTYPEANQSYLVIDAFDEGSYIKVLPEEAKVIGWSTKNAGGVAKNFKNYFVFAFDTPFIGSETWGGEVGKLEVEGEHVGAILQFESSKPETEVHFRVASSFIGFEQAERNLKEIHTSDFEELRDEGRQSWDDLLGRFKVEGTDDQKRLFYTCLYRSTLFPRKFYEIDEAGEVMHYSPNAGLVEPGYYFTDTGFWDTFRSLFPLLNTFFPSMNAIMTEGLENCYNESGWLPEWATPGHRNCMVGNNSTSIVADAWLSGIRGNFSIERLYEAMLKGANDQGPVESVGRKGWEDYNALGYVSRQSAKESAARTLEYAFNDWSIWQLAKSLNRPKEEIDLYAARSQNYRNLFSSEHGLMVGRNRDGSFNEDFSPISWGGDFTEGNSLHYTWSVFHDIEGLIGLMGGDAKFIEKLDSIFSMGPAFDKGGYRTVIHEIREMQVAGFGNYAHGNQPIQHMIYLYNYAGEPWKTQYWVREVMNRLYTPTPDGYCGDEDNGQTSAWFVWSALGFYPVCPGSGELVLGAPLFRQVSIELENGKTLVIDAPNNSDTNRYVQSVKVNGKVTTRNYITLEQLRQGGVIEFEMGDKPNKKRGIAKADAPYSFSRTIDFQKLN